MATKVDSFPSRNGPPSKYPWAEWDDGSIWKIRRGDDFEIPTKSMAVVLYAYATRRGRKVRTIRTDDAVTFQFSDPN